MTSRSSPQVVAARDRRLGMGILGLVVLGLSTMGTAHVAVHAKRIETAIALGKEERLFRELSEQRRHLEIEKGMLKDPRRLTHLAKTALDMGPVNPKNIHDLGKGKPAPAKGDPP